MSTTEKKIIPLRTFPQRYGFVILRNRKEKSEDSELAPVIDINEAAAERAKSTSLPLPSSVYLTLARRYLQDLPYHRPVLIVDNSKKRKFKKAAASKARSASPVQPRSVDADSSSEAAADERSQ